MPDAQITVSWSELKGSPHILLRPGYAEVTRELRCAWNDAVTLCRELLGYWAGPSTYYRPHQYKEAGSGSERLYNCYASEAKIDPYNAPSSNSGEPWSQAKVTVYYTVRDYMSYTDDNVWIEESFQSGSEFVVLDHRNIFFGTGNDAVPIAPDAIALPAHTEERLEWVFVVHNVPILRPGMFDYQNCVNNEGLSSPTTNLIFPTETLLFGNPTVTREDKTSSVGSFGSWTLTYRFHYKNNGTFADPKGWNHFPRTDNASGTTGLSFERLTNGSDSIPIYPLVNYSDVVYGMW